MSATSPANNTVIIVASVAGLLYLTYRWLRCIPLPGIPYNENAAYTLLGDLPEIFRAADKEKCVIPWFGAQTAKHNSPIVQVFPRPFSKPWLVISDYKESQDILLRRTAEFDRSELLIDAFTGLVPEFHLCLKSEDPAFKIHKNLLKDLMTPTFLNTVAAPHIHASASYLVKYWLEKAQLAGGRPFNAIDDLFNAVLDSITAVTFGLGTEDGITALQIQNLSNTNAEDIKTNADGTAEFSALPAPSIYRALVRLIASLDGIIAVPLPKLYHWYQRMKPSYRKANQEKEEMIKRELESGLARSKKGNFFPKCSLDNVLHRELGAAEKAGRQPNYMTRAISDEMFGFLVAGHDTSATTMSWAVKYMASYQQTQKRLRSELHNAYSAAFLEQRDPTMDEITRISIPYLDATMEEIFRCSAILGVLTRRTQVDTIVMGHRIPKGTDVVFSVVGPDFQLPAIEVPNERRSESSLAVKHQVGTWDPTDVQLFKPDRWLKTDEKGDEVFNALAGPMLTFGAGPRGCFGRRMAYLQIRILLVLLVWNMEFLEIDGELGSLKAYERVSTTPVHCAIRLKPIEW